MGLEKEAGNYLFRRRVGRKRKKESPDQLALAGSKDWEWQSFSLKRTGHPGSGMAT